MEYGGLKLVCFSRGRYGHHNKQCPKTLNNNHGGEARKKIVKDNNLTLPLISGQ
jgi:hypothetical protein